MIENHQEVESFNLGRLVRERKKTAVNYSDGSVVYYVSTQSIQTVRVGDGSARALINRL